MRSSFLDANVAYQNNNYQFNSVFKSPKTKGWV